MQEDNYSAPAQDKLTLALVDVSIPASYENLTIFGTIIREYCAALPQLLQEALPASETAIPTNYSHLVYCVELVVQEAASNIIRHGYREEAGAGELRLQLSLDASEANLHALVILLEDSAPAFNPTLARIEPPNPLDPRESGYGLYLIQKLTDKLEYWREAGKNYLKMVKYLK